MNVQTKEVAGRQETMVFDIVCGQVVNAQETDKISRHDGNTYYFCSETCRRAFEAHPNRYLKAPSYGPFH